MIVRKKPGPWVEAVQFTGKNVAEIVAFLGDAWKRGRGTFPKRLYFDRGTASLKIDPQDWVLRGSSGLLWVEDREIFASVYEGADSPSTSDTPK